MSTNGTYLSNTFPKHQNLTEERIGRRRKILLKAGDRLRLSPSVTLHYFSRRNSPTTSSDLTRHQQREVEVNFILNLVRSMNTYSFSFSTIDLLSLIRRLASVAMGLFMLPSTNDRRDKSLARLSISTRPMKMNSKRQFLGGLWRTSANPVKAPRDHKTKYQEPSNNYSSNARGVSSEKTVGSGSSKSSRIWIIQTLSA